MGKNTLLQKPFTTTGEITQNGCIYSILNFKADVNIKIYDVAKCI
jgi:hypothetical protein